MNGHLLCPSLSSFVHIYLRIQEICDVEISSQFIAISFKIASG